MSAVSFKNSVSSVRPFLPARTAPVPRTLKTTLIPMARGPSLKPKKNIAKVEYDDSKEVNPLQSAFTRRREIWVGRTAMTGFISAVVGELLTGRGALGQLQLETRLPQNVINWAVFGIVAFNFITALNPFGPTFDEDNQADVRKRPAGPTQKAMDPSKPAEYFGTSKAFGFTKKNELFVGRVAMLGFASELIGEVLTKGKGPLGQIGIPLNTAVNPQYATVALAVWIGFFLVAAIGFGNFGQQEGDNEIY
ncbi:g4572 [Coccomyxa elongata]